MQQERVPEFQEQYLELLSYPHSPYSEYKLFLGCSPGPGWKGEQARGRQDQYVLPSCAILRHLLRHSRPRGCRQPRRHRYRGRRRGRGCQVQKSGKHGKLVRIVFAFCGWVVRTALLMLGPRELKPAIWSPLASATSKMAPEMVAIWRCHWKKIFSMRKVDVMLSQKF